MIKILKKNRSNTNKLYKLNFIRISERVNGAEQTAEYTGIMSTKLF